jgi:hypothetical protein
LERKSQDLDVGPKAFAAFSLYVHELDMLTYEIKYNESKLVGNIIKHA